MSRPSSQKRRPVILATSVAVLCSLGFLLSVQRAAADEYWDGTSTAGSGNPTGLGGTGVWNTTDPANTNWVDNNGQNPHTYNQNDTAIFSGMGGGTITLGSDIPFTALRFDVGGYVLANGGGKLSAASSIGTITVQNVSVTIDAQLTGSGTIDYEGAGTIVVTNTANDYTGGTIIGTGGVGPTIVINSDSQLGSSSGLVTMNGGTLETTGPIATTRNFELDSPGGGTFSTDSGGNMQILGTVFGAGALTKTGPGALELDGTNFYTGGTNIFGGTLIISSDANLGLNSNNQPAGDLTFNNGTLQTTGNFATSRNVSLLGNAVFNPSPGTFFRIDGAITGAGSITVTGTGTLGFSSGGNTYSGDTLVQNGSTLEAAATNTMSRFSTISLDTGGTFNMNGLNQTVGGIAGSGTVQLGGGTLSAGNNNANTTFAGVIQDNGGLTKIGTGTLTLTGKNTYTGRTTVNGGTLVSAPATAAAADSVLSSTSTLTMGGGTFQQNGVAGGDVTQTLNGLTINAGSNSITINNLGTSTTLDLRGGGTAGIVHNGGVVDFNAAVGDLNTTTAVIMTHQANDANGMIGAWATVNHGAAFAKNDGSDHIVAFADSDYLDIAARGDVVPNAPGKNVRINSAGTAGPDTLAQDTTDVLTLTQNNGTDAVISMASQTLRVGATGGFFITPTGGNLTLGSTPNSGTVTAGGPSNNTAGEMIFDNNAAASLLTVNAVIADNGTGSVAVTIGGTGTTVFAGNNTYTGLTNVSGGTLRLDTVNSLPAGGTVRVNTGATLNLNNNSQDIAAIFDGAAGGGTIALGSATLTLGNTNANSIYSGVITGTGNVVKNGSAALVLSGNSTYTGGTTLNSGTLIVNGRTEDGTGTPLGTGTLTINGGTLATNIQTASSSGTILSNPISVHGDFSVGTNVNQNNPGGQNFTLAGMINLNGATRTITGVTNGGQVHFGAGGIGAGASDDGAGVNFNTTFTADGDYVAFIFDPSNANHYKGLTTVNNGAFIVFEGMTPNAAILGNVDIEGNGVVDYINGPIDTLGQIADGATVTVNSKGNTLGGSHFDGLELRGASDTIGALYGNGTVGLGGSSLGGGTLTVGAGNFSGVIEDGAFGTGGTLVKNTTGTLVLSGANTYTGGTLINEGTLQAGMVNTLSSASAVTVASGATLDLNGFSQKVNSISGAGAITLGTGTLTTGGTSATSTFSGNISGSGGLTKVGTGTLTLSGANTYTGNTTLTRGTIIINPATNPSVLDEHSMLVVGGTQSSDGGTFQLNGVAATNVTQKLNGLTVNTGNSIIAVNNTGISTTLDLRGPNGTAGITRNSGGFVDFRATAGTLGGNAIIMTHQANDASGILGTWATVNGGTAFAANNGSDVIVAYTGYHDIANQGDIIPNDPNANVRINILGSGGDDTIAAPNTRINTLTQNFSAAATVDTGGGTLRLGSDGAIMITAGSAALTIGDNAAGFNPGTLTAGAGTDPTTPTSITFANFSANDLTINSKITDGGGGPLSVRFTGTGTTIFNSANTYSGETDIFSGTLRTSVDDAITTTSAVKLNTGATLDLNGHSQTVASITDGPSGGGSILLGSGTLTTGSDNTNAILSGAISGGGGQLVKVGTGALTLSGSNSYTGGTTLKAGTLVVNNTSALGTGTLTIQGGTIGTQLGSGVAISNAVSAQNDFSVFTNVDTTTISNQNFSFNGPTFDLNNGTRTITGLTDGSNIQFGGTIQNGGVTFTTASTAPDFVKFIYNGANTYTGKTTVNNVAVLVFQGTTANAGALGDVDIEGNGVVEYQAGGNSSQIGDNSTVTVNSRGNSIQGEFFGGLDLVGSSAETIGTLNGSTNGVVSLGAANLTISAGEYNGAIIDGFHPNGSGGAISGGKLTKIGSGTLTLNAAGNLVGENEFTGGVNLNAGVLKIDIDSALGVDPNTHDGGGPLTFNGGTLEVTGISAGDRAIVLNSAAVVQVDANAQLEWDGTINGGAAASLTKNGTGDLFITNTTNTFTGGTIVNAGQLFLSGKLVSSVTVNDTGTFITQGTADLTGAGPTLVTVNKGGTYDNFTTITTTTAGSIGTHLTGDGATFYNNDGSSLSAETGIKVDNTTGVATVVNRGTVAANAGAAGTALDATTSAGVTIGDFGTFTGKVLLGTGTNTVVIATNTTYTPIVGGAGANDTLRLVGGGEDTLKIADFSKYEFLSKVGGGIWNLVGTNPFSGGTSIEGGTLNVRGDLISNTVVQSLGTLSGSGRIVGNVSNFGIVNPGLPTDVLSLSNRPGTLTINGHYQQNSQGNLVIQVNGTNASQFSKLAVSGQARLNGGLLVETNGNTVNLKLGQKITFLTADGGVSGKFSDVFNDLATGTVVVGKIVYDANSVSVQGAQGSFMTIDHDVHYTSNQKAVARVMDQVSGDKREARLMAFLDSRPIKKLPGDFDHIAPEEMASVYRIGVSLADVQTRNVQRRTADLRAGASGFSASGFQTTGDANYSGGLAGPPGEGGKDGKEVPPDRRLGTFITGVGDFAHVGDSGNARGYDLNTGGVTVGADYRLTDRLAVGMTTGYTGTNANLTEDGRVLVNGGKVGVYATYYTGGYYADAAVTGGLSNYSTRRSSLEGDAWGSTQGKELDVMVSTGYDWRMDALTIGPTASFQYAYVGIDGFTERGSLTPMRYLGQHQSSIRSNFGLRVAYDWKMGGVVVRPEVSLAWEHEYGDRSYTIDSALASGAGGVLSVSDTPIGRDSLLFGAGVAVLWNPRTSTYLYYDADLLKKEYNSQSVNGGLRLNF